jgi:hypothetical protein
MYSNLMKLLQPLKGNYIDSKILPRRVAQCGTTRRYVWFQFGRVSVVRHSATQRDTAQDSATQRDTSRHKNQSSCKQTLRHMRRSLSSMLWSAERSFWSFDTLLGTLDRYVRIG